MSDKIYRRVWLTEKKSIAPINVVWGSMMPICLEVMDYHLEPGTRATAYARETGREDVFLDDCLVDGQTICFTPTAGLFSLGDNKIQMRIDVGGIRLYSFEMDVVCGENLEAGSDPASPEELLPYVQRAEAAADRAETILADIPGVVENSMQLEITEQVMLKWGFTKNTGDYTKPVSGIPESDLAQDVRDKLNNPAQSVTEQTVADWGFTKNTGTYVKPASGIPETDLSAEVQEKLNNAPTLEDVPGNLVLYEATDSSEEEQTIEALMLDKLTLEADGTYIYLKFGQTVLGMVEAGSGGAETIYCTDIVIDQESLTVSMGSTGENTLTATVSPSDCTQLVRWSSSDPSVVTVSSAGVLTVVGVGTATITAKCGTKSASITVTVVDNRKTFSIVSGGIVAEGTVATFDPRGDRASISPMLLYVGARNTVKVTCTSMDFYYGPSGWLVSGSNEDLTGPTVSTSGRILDAGWQQGEYTGTISGWTHLSINAKKSNGTSFTDADLTTLQNALRIEVE